MNKSYKDYIDKIKRDAVSKANSYPMPLFPDLNKVIGNIEGGVFTLIGGAASTGRSSFIDTNYVMNVLLKWHKEGKRKPLKIFYFSMTTPEEMKMQNLLCSFLMMVDRLRVNTATLNNKPGRLFDLAADEGAISSLDYAAEFFDDVEKHKALEIIDGVRPVSYIYSKVKSYMAEIGEDKEGKPYKLNEDEENGMVLVIIDSLDDLAPELDGYGARTRIDIMRFMIRTIEELTHRYKVSVVGTLLTDTGFVRQPKDTLPKLKHLGEYGRKADIGIILYNPILESTDKWLVPTDDPSVYLLDGSIILRFWFVVRNTKGADAVHQRFLILPGSNYVVEFPVSGEQVQDWEELYDYMIESESPYI